MNLKNKKKEKQLCSILETVNEYYTKKILTHGATPAGVDWNGKEGQHLRFDQLLKIISPQNNFTLTDLGCGYGDLFFYLKKQGHKSYKYTGIDISEEMIKQALLHHKDEKNTRFLVGSTCPEITDYCVASGIFNVMLDHDKEKWKSFIIETLHQMHTFSKKGFSCNFLTSYSDVPFMKPYLYYADPCYYFDYCKRHFSKDIAVLHDYGLYEFTILIRK